MALGTKPDFRERCTRWLLLLTLLHTVPVVWLTPVAAGTAPSSALLAFGIASLRDLSREGIALGLIVLVPGLVYTSIAWALSWYLAKLLQRVPRSARAWLLGCLTVALLLAVHFPIYTTGGHNSSRSSDLISLFDNTIHRQFLLSYWVALHGVLAALFAGSVLRVDHPLLEPLARWRRPILASALAVASGVILYYDYALILCRPFAELGVTRAQVCVARNAGHDQRYWYERAAGQGNVEALAWLVDKTPNLTTRSIWLRKGAEGGDPASQYGLYQLLSRTEGAEGQEEADRWLRLSADGNHADAQMTLVGRLSKALYRSQSRDLLAERSAWLERAAKNGSRMAKLRLAQHYSDGGMGYPADLERARGYYRELRAVDALTDYEITLGMDAASYERRLNELETWQTGLERRDPAVMRLLAKRYLASQYPGPGVRDLGTALMEQLAVDGDEVARRDLIVLLRTGSSGVDKNLDAAKKWLLEAAEANDPKAMERVASNYMNGREGFPVDYPRARQWIEALIAIDQASDARDAKGRLQRLENDLKYIDRLGGYAGTAMLGSEDLEALGQRGDAQSQYEHAIQLLVGHGSARRAEAVTELHEAASKGHGGAAWRLVQIYERGSSQEIDKSAGLEQLKLAVANHHFDATRELAMSYEKGKRGLAPDLPKAIALYEAALEAGHDNRHGWNLDPETFKHFRWLESRLRQARLKLDAESPEA
jgi:TPR repeat protein